MPSGLLLALSAFFLISPASAAGLQDVPPRRDSVSAAQADSARPARLGAITVRESVRPPHPYAAPWNAAAAKTGVPLRDTPQSVTVVTSALMREQSMISMADALRYTPGITMGQGEGHRDAPTIRGNSSTADFFVDGMRDDAQYFRDLYNVERVEALGGANAMAFGRGGGGGVINRVTKKAQWLPTRDLTMEGGSFGHRRGLMDYGDAITPGIAVRVNGMAQHSMAFRDGVTSSRAGVSPTAALRVGERTVARFGAEYFEDRRTIDRGVPSFRGRPSNAPLDRFFGNPDSSYARAKVASADLGVEHRFNGRTTLRAQGRLTAYDKFYQNVVPGVVDTAGTRVNLSAYNAALDRTNLFSQTELSIRFATVRMPQTILVGVEAGRQATDNQRLTGYFNGTATTLSVPFDTPTVRTPVAFRPSTTDANSHVVVTSASLYTQSQLSLTAKLQATLGVRLERFDLRHLNNRTGQRLDRKDDVLSPRVGVVYKPVIPVSLYSTYSVSSLPSSGDQFSGLTATTQTLEPERFGNREFGIKWDLRPDLTLATAAYRLARTNSAAPSALDPGVIVQTGRQVTTGYEVSLNGRVVHGWDVAGAFASQQATIASATTDAPAGATVPLVPRSVFSVWNKYQPARALGFAVGTIHQSAMYAAINNAVTLPAFWRIDAAVFATTSRSVQLQANVENVLNRRYYATSHGNNNIMPGAPRTLRVSLTAQIR